MRKLLFIFIAILLPLASFGSGTPETGIKWYTMDQAIKLNREHPKKIFIYIYSNSCGWCKRMAGHTFTNEVIAKYLNDTYYPVKINTDIKDAITIGSKTYNYVPADPSAGTPAYHEFVAFILQGYMAYPAVAFLDKDLVYMGAVRGYKSPADFEPLIHYIGDDAYIQNKDYDQYAEKFTGLIRNPVE